MNEDINEILRCIQAKVKACAEVTDEQVCAKAREMAERGFDFTRTSGDMASLIRHCIGGGGLILRGTVGCGKTFFFRCLGVSALNMRIAQAKRIEEITDALSRHADDPVLIDDIGIEEDGYKSFGTSMDLFSTILEIRCDSSAPTHFTTNLSREELSAKYGARSVDRLYGMAVEREIVAESQRSPDNVANEEWFADFFAPKPWKICSQYCPHYDDAKCVCKKGVKHMPSMCARDDGVRIGPKCVHFLTQFVY